MLHYFLEREDKHLEETTRNGNEDFVGVYIVDSIEANVLVAVLKDVQVL